MDKRNREFATMFIASAIRDMEKGMLRLFKIHTCRLRDLSFDVNVA